jgi:hypothetical protein
MAGLDDDDDDDDDKPFILITDENALLRWKIIICSIKEMPIPCI